MIKQKRYQLQPWTKPVDTKLENPVNSRNGLILPFSYFRKHRDIKVYTELLKFLVSYMI